MSLRQRTTTAVLWNFVQLLSQRSITLIVTLLLARFLVPEDFGLVATMSVFIAIASSMMNSGLKEALIRLRTATELELSTAFLTNVALGIIAYVFLFFSAPLIARFYAEPRLVSLVRVSALSVVINSFQLIQVSVLSRRLDFKTQLKATFPSYALSGLVAVAMSAGGFGVWALVAQTLVSSFLNALFLFYFQRWYPQLIFSFESMREMLGFGYKIFFSETLNLVFKNIYVIVIAKFFAVSLTGYYYFADRINAIVLNQLVAAIQTATYPSLVKFQDNDTKLKTAYRKILQPMTFVVFPVLLFLASLSEPLFRALLPIKWLPAAKYLQLMCLAGIFFPLHTVNINILKVKGRAELLLFVNTIKKATTLIVLFASIPYGIQGVLIGQVVSSILNYVPNAYYSSALIGYRIDEQIRDFLPPLALASGIALPVYLVVQMIDMHPILALTLLSALSSVLYIVVAAQLRLSSFEQVKTLVVDRMQHRLKRRQAGTWQLRIKHERGPKNENDSREGSRKSAQSR